jgi:hypothetical protein
MTQYQKEQIWMAQTIRRNVHPFVIENIIKTYFFDKSKIFDIERIQDIKELDKQIKKIKDMLKNSVGSY